MKILQNLAVLAIAAAVVLTGCANNFTGTDASFPRAKLNSDNNLSATALSVGVSGTLTAGSTIDNMLILTFNKKVDEATIIPSIAIYNLLSTTGADGSPDRGTAITATLSEIRDIDGGGYKAYLNLGKLTGASARIEIFIDPTRLTALDGALKLNGDADRVQGEASDDDFYAYTAVAGGTAASATSRGTFSVLSSLVWTTANTLGTTTWTANYPYFLLDNSDYNAAFAGVVDMEKFNFTTGLWSAVTYTSAYTAATGNWVMTFPAFVAGETYRIQYSNFTNARTAKTVQGYIQKFYRLANYEVLDELTENVADLLNIAASPFSSVAVVKDASGYNVKLVCAIDDTVVGTLGLVESTLTSANFKILRANNVNIPYTVTFRYNDPAADHTANPAHDEVVLTLDPNYMFDGGVSINFKFGLGLKGLGDNTAATDDVYFGDTTQTTEKPYGFWEDTGVAMI